MNLDEVNVVGILGDPHRGKTSLAFTLLRNYLGTREIVLYGYPEQVIDTRTGQPYRQIHTLNELELLTDAVVFMDEMQKHVKFYDKRANYTLLETLSTIAHNKSTLIFTTPMSQFITKAFDCFISGFLYVQISDLGQLKNGSKAKRLLQEFSTVRRGTRTLRLDRGEYIQIVDGQERSNGLHTYADAGTGKAWKSHKNATN